MTQEKPSFVRSSVNRIANLAVLSTLHDGAIFLLPDRTGPDGIIYRDDNAGLVKTARAEGIPITDIRAGESYRYISEYSASQIAADIGIGIVGNLSTDSIKYCYLLAKIKLSSSLGLPRSRVSDSDGHIRMTLNQYRSGSVEVKGFGFEGPLSGLKVALESLISQEIEQEDDGRE